MKKLLVFGFASTGAVTIALSLAGAGVASADSDVVGATYQDARATLGQEGSVAVVASTVGDRVEQDQCIVTSASPAPIVDGYGIEQQARTMVHLNCYANYASTVRPGYSLQSSQGRQYYEADDAVAASEQKAAEEEAAAEQAELDQLEGADAQQAGE